MVPLRPETRDAVQMRISGGKRVQSTELDIVNGSFICVGSLAGVTYLRYTVLTSSNKSETAVPCCDPALSVLVMLVSRNVFSRSISLALFSLHIFLGLIRSLVDPTLAAFIVCGPLQLVTHINIVYVTESAAYGVLFTSCLCQQPERARRASEGFWHKQRVNKTPYKALSMSWAVYDTKQENFHWASFLNAN